MNNGLRRRNNEQESLLFTIEITDFNRIIAC